MSDGSYIEAGAQCLDEAGVHMESAAGSSGQAALLTEEKAAQVNNLKDAIGGLVMVAAGMIDGLGDVRQHMQIGQNSAEDAQSAVQRASGMGSELLGRINNWGASTYDGNGVDPAQQKLEDMIGHLRQAAELADDATSNLSGEQSRQDQRQGEAGAIAQSAHEAAQAARAAAG